MLIIQYTPHTIMIKSQATEALALVFYCRITFHAFNIIEISNKDIKKSFNTEKELKAETFPSEESEGDKQVQKRVETHIH